MTCARYGWSAQQSKSKLPDPSLSADGLSAALEALRLAGM